MATNLELPKSAVDEFELPCGYLDESKVLHTTVTVREMTGEEEEILAAKNMSVTKKFNKIISRCVTQIGAYSGEREVEKIVMSLPQGDRIFLLIAIRRVTLGDDMPFITVCPNDGCNQKSQLAVNLAELEIRKMQDPLVRFYERELPKSKKKVRMKVLDGYGEEALSKASQFHKDIISTAILARVESIEGKPATVADIKALPLADRNYLRDCWADNEGGVETDIQVVCSGCELEYDTTVDLGSAGFFNPSGMLKAWNKKSST